MLRCTYRRLHWHMDICHHIYVQALGSLQMGLKWFVNLWDTYWVLGPESGAKVQPRFYASWFLGPISWYSDCGLASSLAFLIPTIHTCNLIAKRVHFQPLFQLLWVTLKTFCSSCWTLVSFQNYPLLAFLQDFPENWIFLKLTHKVQIHTYVDIM